MAKKKTKKSRIFSFIKKKVKKKVKHAPNKKIKKVKKAKKEESVIRLSQLRYCPDCGSDNIHYIEERDELVCRTCGGIFSHLTPEQETRFKGAAGL